MTRRSKAHAIFFTAAAIALVAIAASAQVTSPAPIDAHQLRTVNPRIASFDGEVIAADAAHIIVRRRNAARFIRTFTYSPEVRTKMITIIERGGYQYGDRVKVRYDTRTEVALAIKGKPSNPGSPRNQEELHKNRATGPQ